MITDRLTDFLHYWKSLTREFEEIGILNLKSKMSSDKLSMEDELAREIMEVGND